MIFSPSLGLNYIIVISGTNLLISEPKKLTIITNMSAGGKGYE